MLSTTGDRGFESTSLQRRVTCEPGFRGYAVFARIVIVSGEEGPLRMASQVQRFLSAHDASSGRHPAGSPRDCSLRGSPRRRFCRACSPLLLGCNRFPPEPCQNTFGDFQLIEFAAQFFPLGIKPRQPLGNPLLLLFHQRSHFSRLSLPLDPVLPGNPSALLEKRKAWISPKREIGMLIHPHSPCAQSVLVMSAYATKNGLFVSSGLTDPTASANRFDGAYDKRHGVKDGDLLVSWSATLDVFVWDRGEAVLNGYLAPRKSPSPCQDHEILFLHHICGAAAAKQACCTARSQKTARG
jgi:hypothetical protein